MQHQLRRNFSKRNNLRTLTTHHRKHNSQCHRIRSIRKFSVCYHKGNLLNLNGQPYSYIDNEWEKVEQKIPPSNKGFVNSFAYTADNSLETFIHMDASNINVADQVSTLADITAVINEHQPDSVIRRPHASSALLAAHEKENRSLLQQIATWVSYFGGITFAIATAMLLFKICGGQTALEMLFSSMGMPPWASYLLSGSFLNLCKKKEKQMGTNNQPQPLGPYTSIQINQNNLDDDSLEETEPRRHRHKKQKREGDKKKKRGRSA
jgi:hypothetical protein